MKKKKKVHQVGAVLEMQESKLSSILIYNKFSNAIKKPEKRDDENEDGGFASAFNKFDYKG